jgi:quercetin dioxygenase-like cupin family protein
LSGYWGGTLSLFEYRDGLRVGAGEQIVYDVAGEQASFGAADVARRALSWELMPAGAPAEGSLLSHAVSLDVSQPWIARCDRIDFPPGGIAYTHTHPGPGIRYLLHGSITIRSEGKTTVYEAGEPWFESGPEPVHATAAADRETAFVRVLLLPALWEGKRTIRYVDPDDEQKPKLQRPTVFFDRPITLPTS